MVEGFPLSWLVSGVPVVVVEVCFEKRVFPDLLKVLLPPVDFVFVCGICRVRGRKVGTHFGIRSVYDTVRIPTAKCGH